MNFLYELTLKLSSKGRFALQMEELGDPCTWKWVKYFVYTPAVHNVAKLSIITIASLPQCCYSHYDILLNPEIHQ
jgi:hypothetical protein